MKEPIKNTFNFCLIGDNIKSLLSMLSIMEICMTENSIINITYISEPELSLNKNNLYTPNFLTVDSKFPKFIHGLLDFSIYPDLERINGTIKYAEKYINFGDKDFYRSYLYHPGLNMDISEFHNFIIERILKLYTKNQIKFINGNIKSIENVENGVVVKTNDKEMKYDYVFDCRDFKDASELKTDDYDCSFEIPVNSVLIYSEKIKYDKINDMMCTETTATKDGWMFGIPLDSHKTFGYVYSNQITPTDNAIKNFRELKNIPNNIELYPSVINSFNKRNIWDGNIITTGNKLYNMHPASSSDIHSLLTIIMTFMGTILRDHNTSSGIINMHDEDIETMINNFYINNIILYMKIEILLFYQGSVNIDSEFWRYAKDWSTKELDNIPKEKIKELIVDDITQQGDHRFENGDYWAIHAKPFNEYLNGLKVDINNYI
jgi:tryptophan 7-halogenase